jgi:hypothetical protein
MVYNENYVFFIGLLIILVAWLLRKTELGFLWQMIKMFFMILFALLAADLIKKEVKEWWNKK